MPTKKNESKKAKAISKETAAVVDKKKCDCKNCDCGCKAQCTSQLSLYVLIGILVATMTILVISIAFNKSVRELFKPSNYIYSGRFSDESDGDEIDDNDITMLSAGAVIDMVTGGNDGILLVCTSGHLACDAISGWLAPYIDSMEGKIYRYDISEEETTDNARAHEVLGLIDENIPDVVYIRDGFVYDRIDNPRSNANLYDFVYKYLPKYDDGDEPIIDDEEVYEDDEEFEEVDEELAE